MFSEPRLTGRAATEGTCRLLVAARPLWLLAHCAPLAAAPPHPSPTREWRAYEQSRIYEAERLLRDYRFKHPEPAPEPLEPAWPHGPGGPGAPSGNRGRGPTPHPPLHLDRQSPVPPGGF